jgi:pentatricopeptide repeat protein
LASDLTLAYYLKKII